MEDDNESMDVSSLSPEDRLWLEAAEKRLMAKYDKIILKAEQQQQQAGALLRRKQHQ